ncbi:THTPA triphosphatase, partial [Amia calva]|nr:THTPA triphosphatase [Amia calva]
MNVEVERKFLCSPDIQTKLSDLGAVSVGEMLFSDQYFDSPDWRLTLGNMWLRRRRDCWELKCSDAGSEGGERKGGGGGGGGGDREGDRQCTCYREITELHEIMARVREQLSGREGAGGKAGETQEARVAKGIKESKVYGEMEGETGAEEEGENEGSGVAWVRALGLQPFAEFITQRHSYRLEGPGGVARVDLDSADFGYCVGEIEVMTSNPGNIDVALNTINTIALLLGLSTGKKVPGKMEVYLQRFHPEHYQRLLAKHIL